MHVRLFGLLTFALSSLVLPHIAHAAGANRPTTRCAPSAKGRIVASRPPSKRKRTSSHYSRTTGTAAS